MRRLMAVVGATLLFAALGTWPSRAQTDGSGLGGFTLEARANVFEYTYASPGLLPTGNVIFQVSLPYSFAQLNNTTGQALSSLAWPGPLLADLGVVVEQGTEEDQRPPFRIPAYPVRAEAFSPQGPANQESEAIPGARMRAFAEQQRVRADTTFSSMLIPGIFDAGGLTSEATSEVVDGLGITTARSTMTDVSLLAGLIHIGELVTEVTTTSDGVTATAETSTDVAGLTFAGAAATVDEEGIHLAEQQPGGNDATDLLTEQIPFGDITGGTGQVTEAVSSGLQSLLEQAGGGLNELAEQSGIIVRLFPGTATVDGAEGESSSSGLQIELFYDGQTTPVMSDLLALVPISELPSEALLPIPFNTSPQALVSLLQETHINTISLGSAGASAVASEAFVVDFDFDLGTTGGSGAGSGTLSGSTGSSASSAGSASPGGGSSGGTGGAAVGGLPTASGDALPGTLVVVVIIALPVFASASRRLASFTLGT